MSEDTKPASEDTAKSAKTKSVEPVEPTYSLEESAGNYLKTSGIGSCKRCGEKKATAVINGEVTVFCPKGDKSCPMV